MPTVIWRSLLVISLLTAAVAKAATTLDFVYVVAGLVLQVVSTSVGMTPSYSSSCFVRRLPSRLSSSLDASLDI
jgi:hypothetical protein